MSASRIGRQVPFVYARTDIASVVEDWYGWRLELLEGVNQPGRGPVARTRRVLIAALLASDWPPSLIDTITASTRRQRELVSVDAQYVTEGVSVAVEADRRWRARTGVPPADASVRLVCRCGEDWSMRHAGCTR